MKIHTIVFAVIAALALSVFGTAQAQDHGARKAKQAVTQHRAAAGKFQRGVDGHQANQRARTKQGMRSGGLNHKQVARLQKNQRQVGRLERRIIKHKLDRASKRIWRMKGKRYRARPYLGKHRRFKHNYRRPYVHHSRVYPVYADTAARSIGIDIETEVFRFSVNKSD